MIDYKLLQQLKDAGYLIKEELDGFQGATQLIEPTLSELIEACGEGFLLKKTKIGWRAVSRFERECMGEYGKTPEIAVARLWLALNGKE